jgi:hypothetical protein
MEPADIPSDHNNLGRVAAAMNLAGPFKARIQVQREKSVALATDEIMRR